MSSISEQDYQKVLAFLQGLYGNVNYEDFSSYIVGSIGRLIPSSTPVFATADFGSCEVVASGDIPEIPGLQELFRDHFYEHPFVEHHAKTFDPSACKLSDFWTQEQLHGSEMVYHRFMRYLDAEDVFNLSFYGMTKAGLKGKYLAQGASIHVDSINLFRDRRSFSERDRSILNLLRPHLVQARQATQDFAQMQQSQQYFHDFLEMAGSIVLSREGRIQTLTQKAEQLLKHYFNDFRHFSLGLPERLKQWVKYQQSLLSGDNATLKPLLPLKVEQGDKLLNIRFAADPNKEQYLLLLSEQQLSRFTAQLLENLGLTRREAEILFWVMEGKTNAEISSLLNITVSTVRKHLEHIYVKLEVQTRAGAVVAALKGLGVLNLDWCTD